MSRKVTRLKTQTGKNNQSTINPVPTPHEFSPFCSGFATTPCRLWSSERRVFLSGEAAKHARPPMLMFGAPCTALHGKTIFDLHMCYRHIYDIWWCMTDTCFWLFLKYRFSPALATSVVTRGAVCRKDAWLNKNICNQSVSGWMSPCPAAFFWSLSFISNASRHRLFCRFRPQLIWWWMSVAHRDQVYQWNKLVRLG